MDDIENYCLRLYRSQRMSELWSSGDNYDTVSILRGVELSSWTYVATQRVIWIPLEHRWE